MKGGTQREGLYFKHDREKGKFFYDEIVESCRSPAKSSRRMIRRGNRSMDMWEKGGGDIQNQIFPANWQEESGFPDATPSPLKKKGQKK